MSEKAIFMGIMDCLKREASVFCNRRKGRNGKLRYCPYARTDEEDGSVSFRLSRIEDLTKDCSCKMWFRTEKKGRKKT